MSFFGFLIKKRFYIHLGLSIILTVILFFIVLQFIKIYSNHGDTYVLPDFSGKTLAEIENDRYDQLYEFIVIDSIFDTHNPKGSVVIQNPPAGSVVKQNRKVYVTLVAYSTEKVEMPDLIDLSLRQAVNSLRSKGLIVNQLQYVEDFAGNAILEQLYDSEVIEEGSIIEKGSGIDLVVGLGQGHYAPIPFLVGLKLTDAIDAINKASFNVGNVYFLDGEDPEHDRVYRQRPAWDVSGQLFKGNTMNISLRSNLDFDFDALIQELKPDTMYFSDTTKIIKPEF
ncbi:MAG: PASTA domain-containing protein [Bacteroidales bacterium]|nr:PASTA domain-containing protein [Bacteroidales bacterium]